MLKIHSIITEHSLEYLVEKYNLIRKDLGNLVILQYHQIDTPINEFTNECRALILDKEDNHRVICKSFTRFHDYDSNTKDFNFENFYVTPKIDGSLINMWWYNNKWNVSTKSEIQNHVLFPELIFGAEHSLDSLFWKIFHERYELPKDPNKTYIFEFKHPHSPFITKSPGYSITLIGCTDLDTLQEVDIDTLDQKWEKIPKIKMDLQSVLEQCVLIDPTKEEGFVIVDNQFRRLKVKSPQYEAIGLLAKHYPNESEERRKLVDENNKRRILEIIRWNNFDTFLADYPDVTDLYVKYKKIYQYLIEKIQNNLNYINSLENNKEKGLYINQNQLKYLNGLVFGRQPHTIEQHIQSFSLNNFIELIEQIEKDLLT